MPGAREPRPVGYVSDWRYEKRTPDGGVAYGVHGHVVAVLELEE